MKMTSMKIGDESIEQEELEVPAYPYGLCLYLNEKTLKKLGFKGTSLEEFEIGEEFALAAMVKVTGISMREYEGQEPSQSVDLQITEMALMDAGDEEEAEKATTVGGKLYGKD